MPKILENIAERRARRNAERRAKLVAEVVKHGRCTGEVAEKAVQALETERPILDWLAKVNWIALLELALKLLPLFLTPAPTAKGK